MAVEFWFEFASTRSYPATLRIEASPGRIATLIPFAHAEGMCALQK